MIFLSIIYFLSWTLLLYWIHRITHSVDCVKKYHLDHHRYINTNQGSKSKWEFNNLFLFNDNKNSTIDLWITEVIPTIIFCYITTAWWIFLFYYVWAAIFQETLEHKNSFNFLWFTAGAWHLEHHKNYKKNYGLFIPIWDIIFNTNKSI
jgi:sterol desaturase/sphingolipid hydroxylase (fatty acid hydroxylase superfamily)